MIYAAPETWPAANRRRLAEAVSAVRAALGGEAFAPGPPPPLDPPARLDAIATLFGLGRADMLLLLLAAAPDLDPTTLDGQRPTVAHAIALGGEAVWAALCPQAPLRRWRIVEPDGSGAMPARTLRLDERILQHLLGIDYLDARLDGLVEPLAPPTAVASADEAALAARFAPLWQPHPESGWPVLQICGADRDGRRAVAAALAAPCGQRLFRLARADVPRPAFERLALARLCDREMALSNGVLLVEGEGGGDDEDRAAAGFVDLLLGPTIVAARDPLALDRAHRLRADLPPATIAQRRSLWTRLLGDRAGGLGDGLDLLAEQFTLDGPAVRAAIEIAAGAEGANETARLWDAARAQARRRLDDLAERIDAKAGWADLVVPADRLAQLRDITVHVRRAHQVHGRWGWAARGARGLGVTALFAGPSGTGKTMAAEVLATDLRLDLYRIDLSQVVSKYIGETEKNLRRIFEAAEASGAILLFDEADALFGKRSEVKDSHDRYANVEVSYLLQRMEAYRGLAVLTTNLKGSLDPAFMRRLRFVVDFPFPDQALRREIWRRVFPPETPLGAIDHARLARLAVAGGAIRTIAVNAAFLAAEAGGAVEGHHILAAARREYAKLDKAMTTAEFGGAA